MCNFLAPHVTLRAQAHICRLRHTYGPQHLIVIINVILPFLTTTFNLTTNTNKAHTALSLSRTINTNKAHAALNLSWTINTIDEDPRTKNRLTHAI